MGTVASGLNQLSKDNAANYPRPVSYNPYEYVGMPGGPAAGGAEYLNMTRTGGGGGEKRISVNPYVAVQYGPATTYSYPTPYGYAPQQALVLSAGAPSETATSVDSRVIPNPIIAIGVERCTNYLRVSIVSSTLLAQLDWPVHTLLMLGVPTLVNI